MRCQGCFFLIALGTRLEQSSQNRWTNPQTEKLVELWKANIVLIEFSRSHETWLKITAEIDKLGKQKTVLQCRSKIRNLKDIYKNAKGNNAKTGSSPTFPQYFHHFDEVPSCRAVVNMPEMIEAGQVFCNADVPVFTSSDTNHCQQSKEDGFCVFDHLVSNCLLILSPSFSRYCKNLRRVTQFVQIIK